MLCSRLWVTGSLFLSALGCWSPARAPPVAPTADALVAAPVAGFEAEPLQRFEGFVRRVYRSAAGPITVTVVSGRVDASAYAQWQRMSRDYPAVTLPVEREAADGFFS